MPNLTSFQRIGICCAWLLCAAARAGPALPALGVDLRQTTVSGVSSGAYMAGQFGVAYSASVAGVGLIAGGPYYCAGEPEDFPPLWNALYRCTNPSASFAEPPDAVLLWARTQAFARAGLIDDVAYLRLQRVFIFSGARDRLVTTTVADQARNFYDFAGVAELGFVDTVPAGHGMITDRATDNACDANRPPYFNNCRMNLAGQLLAALYPGLDPPDGRLHGTLQRFDQRRYARADSGLARDGFLFVPLACWRTACRVHVAFHGCYQSAAIVSDHFYRYGGYNETAGANRIVVLYPQVRPTEVPYNPLACWDYWGYAGPDYYARSGAQMRAVRAMLERLGQAR